MSIVQCKEITKTYRQGKVDVTALHGISLEVAEGDFVTIIGTNGSGKSTLLNAVAGAFLPDTGPIKIDGRDVSRDRDYVRAKLVSRVFQNPYMGTAPDMTIAENLLMAKLRGERHYPKISLNRTQMTRFEGEVALLEMQLETRLN
ncbi:MAG: ATP-binding cassette domain-containing protein, partial [Acidobacteriota bacterium]